MERVKVVINFGDRREIVMVDRAELAKNMRLASEHAKKSGVRPGEHGFEPEIGEIKRLKGVKVRNEHQPLVTHLMSHDKFATIYTAGQQDVEHLLQESDLYDAGHSKA